MPDQPDTEYGRLIASLTEGLRNAGTENREPTTRNLTTQDGGMTWEQRTERVHDEALQWLREVRAQPQPIRIDIEPNRAPLAHWNGSTWAPSPGSIAPYDFGELDTKEPPDENKAIINWVTAYAEQLRKVPGDNITEKLDYLLNYWIGAGRPK